MFSCWQEYPSKEDLPCLLSKDSMKRAGAVIDVGNDDLEIFGNKMKMKVNGSGHYTLQFSDYIRDEFKFFGKQWIATIRRRICAH